ncbi:BrnT family toxin [Lichenihabitans sp. Uapishka_5]|uniref:BrnT family toxin n=1 Tax=Lichenihabitans sp. Uapishka_5 TaxID=3037302 RepID=UPI0029E7E7EF|nr:BrnT family toxin [Lichenihabitans sp. Uapishka_5]MDX7952778.1 BrnT family toxin [Lichenihabitans sp. Uapishka_5]
MLFDWDEAKSERTLHERGFDFEFVAHVFDRETEEFVDTRKDYGEVRIIAFGRIEAELYGVVYTQRGDIRWIISAFRCRHRELERWKRRAAEG